MGTVNGFEELLVWKKSRGLVGEVYSMTSQGAICRDYALKDQMRRAAVSVLSNIAEGFERGGNKEFIQFLYIAKGSAGELRAQMYVAQDQGYVSPQNSRRLMIQLGEISKMLNGLIRYLKRTEIKGDKFRIEEAEGIFDIDTVPGSQA
ncbi:MAG: four helix bundle protein [Gammaproteobacteria bacterium]|nr:four helix bundle protein [Gammaproteobacteria bacterium]MCW8959442.1 four helix bundle protein [Gammaproteobacteria bacterium]MCW8993315.1 four helix bundle protein [Gammaproteobacteria bacterium]